MGGGLLSRNFNGESIVAVPRGSCSQVCSLPTAFLTWLVIKIISHNVRKRRQQITTKSARPKSFTSPPSCPAWHCPPWCPVKRASGNYLARHNNLASPLIGQVGRTSSDSCGRRKLLGEDTCPTSVWAQGKASKLIYKWPGSCN